ncbi:hypothetical protein ERHA55_46140 [Erwinia rhapontici]|nr:hypothetical protein ERHA55_46140 [Erwinia rhapontici]
MQEVLGEQLRITGDTDIAVERLLLKAKTENNQLQLLALDVDSPQGQLNAQGQATLSGNWPVNFTLYSQLNVDPIKGEKIKMTLGGGLRDTLTLGLNLSGPVRAQLDADTQLAEAGLPLNMTLHSPQLRWPLDGQAQYQADNFNFSFKGKATDYVMSLKAALQGQGIPPATLTLNGKGNVEQFSLDKLRLAALQGIPT